MKNWLVKTAFNLLGGVEGLVEMAIAWFNSNVLQKIKDKEEFAAYADDCIQFAAFLEGIIARHEKWMDERKRKGIAAIIEAVKTLAEALKDCEVTKEEVDALVDAVVAAIKAWEKEA